MYVFKVVHCNYNGEYVSAVVGIKGANYRHNHPAVLKYEIGVIQRSKIPNSKILCFNDIEHAIQFARDVNNHRILLCTTSNISHIHYLPHPTDLGFLTDSDIDDGVNKISDFWNNCTLYARCAPVGTVGAGWIKPLAVLKDICYE